MTDFNLPAAYAELVAKRPELAVSHRLRSFGNGSAERWYWQHAPNTIEKTMLPIQASALITAKLLAELPRFHSLVNGRYREGDGWYVKDDNENTIYANTRDRYGPKSDTPLRALLAFHLKGTT